MLSENTLNSALAAMGYKGQHTAHGFRSLFSTGASAHGHDADVIERQLAHKERNEVRAAHHRAKYLAERAALMQWWADDLDGRMGAARWSSCRGGPHGRRRHAGAGDCRGSCTGRGNVRHGLIKRLGRRDRGTVCSRPAAVPPLLQEEPFAGSALGVTTMPSRKAPLYRARLSSALHETAPKPGSALAPPMILLERIGLCHHHHHHHRRRRRLQGRRSDAIEALDEAMRFFHTHS